MKVGLLAGHSKPPRLDPSLPQDDPNGQLYHMGAVANGIVEFKYCHMLAHRVGRLLHRRGHKIESPIPAYDEPKGDHIGPRVDAYNAEGVDIALDLHLNACDSPWPSYGWMIYNEGSVEGKKLANCLADTFWALCPELTDDYRATPPEAGKSFAFLRDTHMPAVIVEPSFMTSPRVAEILQSPGYRFALADAISYGVLRYFHERG